MTWVTRHSRLASEIGVVAVVTYEYDNRNRLIDEERAITSPYHLSYTYDQLGNRLTKVDHAAGLTTTYHYDVEDPQTYGTLNNRLMYYEVHDASPALMERVDYQYEPSPNHVATTANIRAGANGSPTFIVRKRANEAFYRGTTLQYQENGSLWFLIEQVWPDDDEYCDFREVVSIKEVRGVGRGRYVTRLRNPADPMEILPGTSVWSDYDGDSIYGDYRVDEQTGSVTELTGYLPGVSQYDAQTGEIRYFHADQIGTVRVVTDDFGQVIARSVSTAFGEAVHTDGTVGTRYQYAGAWGYEAFEDTPFVHVGFRWYDPSTGRFLQRDPIGIDGGLNTYDYTMGNPVDSVDPSGETILDVFGPSGPLFGRGRLTPSGAAGFFNRGNVCRLGWSWRAIRLGGPSGNLFSLHGGMPGTPGHWHLYFNHPWVQSGPGAAPFAARLAVRGAQGAAAVGAAYVGWKAGEMSQNAVRSYYGRTGWDMIFRWGFDRWNGVGGGRGILDY